MSKEKPVGLVAKGPQVRYSAAYPTGRERIVKVTPLPCGLSAGTTTSNAGIRLGCSTVIALAAYTNIMLCGGIHVGRNIWQV